MKSTLPAIAALCAASFSSAMSGIQIQKIGQYSTGIFAQGGAEISAYDARTRKLFVVKATAAEIDVLDFSNPASPAKISSVDISAFGAGVNSVAARGGLVAAAVEGSPKTAPGKVAFFLSSGAFLTTVDVGSLPDMLTFTPDGSKVLVACEGEPSNDYSIDPLGAVSVIDIPPDLQITQANVVTIDFSSFDTATLDPSVRIFGPGASVGEDLEPEYITVSEDSQTAWIALQENNAIARIDLATGVVTEIRGLGFKNHNLTGSGFDPSDKDNAIQIANWPVFGMYQPDGIASFRIGSQDFIVSANEGDTRSYPGFTEDARVKNVTLDSTAFPNAATLKQDANLGRLTVTKSTGDVDGDGDLDALYAFGARSFTIWDDSGNLVWDSADRLEQITSGAYPLEFNSDNESNGSFDTRSDNKGPEPEGIAVGWVRGRAYAFVGLERIGGVAIFDVTNPFAPAFEQYLNTRDFTGNPSLGTAGDLGPEGMIFIPSWKSPNGKPLLVVSNEISGTVAVFEISLN